MACDAQTLVTDSECLVEAMSERQLLASIAYQLAVAASVEATPAVLAEQSKCLLALSDRELLASIAYLQCQLAGG